MFDTKGQRKPEGIQEKMTEFSKPFELKKGGGMKKGNQMQETQSQINPQGKIPKWKLQSM